jgi:hypothetical protein
MVLETLNFIRPRKPTELLSAWKTSSHPITSVKKTVEGGWRLEFELCSKVHTTTP